MFCLMFSGLFCFPLFLFVCVCFFCLFSKHNFPCNSSVLRLILVERFFLVSVLGSWFCFCFFVFFQDAPLLLLFVVFFALKHTIRFYFISFFFVCLFFWNVVIFDFGTHPTTSLQKVETPKTRNMKNAEKDISRKTISTGVLTRTISMLLRTLKPFGDTCGLQLIIIITHRLESGVQ